jgi:hypothetical protein
VPPCVDIVEAYPGPTLDEGESLLSGQLTIHNVQYLGGGAVSFDWTSTVPIGSIDVEGHTPPFPTQHYGYPAGTFSGTGLHAPNNDTIKSLFVCLQDAAGLASLSAQHVADDVAEAAAESESVTPTTSEGAISSTDATEATTPTTEAAVATTEEAAATTEAAVGTEPSTGTTTPASEPPVDTPPAETPPAGTGV